MTMPIYEQAMGAGFARLQPELQDYFSLAPGSGTYGVGEGVFDVVGCRQQWLRPLLRTDGQESRPFSPNTARACRSGSKTMRILTRSAVPA